MILWIFLALTLIGIALVTYDGKKMPVSDAPMIAGWVLSIICGLTTVIMLCVIIFNNAGSEGRKLAAEEKYKALVYKAKTEACRDEFGIVNKAFIDEIQEWNMNCVRIKELQEDFWIGIFIPDIYDNFKTIDLSSIEYRKVEKKE